VAALLEDLRVRRHVRRGLATGVAVAALVFVAFAYLPGTEESLLYWAGLSVVLATGVAGLVTTLLVARAAVRRTRAVHDLERDRRSPATRAVLVGLGGWLVVAVAATLLLDRPDAGLRLAVATVAGGFLALATGGLAVRVAVALSVTHVWRPRAVAAAAVADTAVSATAAAATARGRQAWVTDTAVLAAPAVGCPSGGPCLDTPDRLAGAVAGLDPTGVAAGYVAVVVVGSLAVGAVLGWRAVSPPNAVAAGGVAAVATLPLAAAATGDPGAVRATALYLPVLAGLFAGIGATAALAASSPAGSPER
jgi:hypothetical protein